MDEFYVVKNGVGEYRGKDGTWVGALHEAAWYPTERHAKHEAAKYHEALEAKVYKAALVEADHRK